MIRVIDHKVMFVEAASVYDSDYAMVELTIDDDGQVFYLFGDWSEEIYGEMPFCTATKSLINLHSQISKASGPHRVDLCHEWNDLCLAVPRDVSKKYYDMFAVGMEQMLIDELEAHGIYPDAEE